MTQRTANITTGSRKRRLGGNSLIILANIVLVIMCAGLAGQAVVGNVKVVPGAAGRVQVTSSQALTVIGGSVAEADAGRVIVNDDGTAFIAPAVLFRLPSTPGLSD